MIRAALLLASLFSTSLFSIGVARTAEPVRIGITTILSGPIFDRGQSEQYGAQLARRPTRWRWRRWPRMPA
jgi:branched-chain amino acid transport system substrate-binding protein